MVQHFHRIKQPFLLSQGQLIHWRICLIKTVSSVFFFTCSPVATFRNLNSRCETCKWAIASKKRIIGCLSPKDLLSSDTLWRVFLTEKPTE
ncbi:hypothetical protein PHET_11756 [Paragonimus heterotremus]|uniref:Uncharacterized protein n=1 Tax=Paragonimus heterotremus TaxID=100268 RepID=A0A8J4WDH5_9TREM|nr:hypothetical protein PHET_11756 [Paragonimus heterotremus]